MFQPRHRSCENTVMAVISQGDNMLNPILMAKGGLKVEAEACTASNDAWKYNDTE